MIADALGPIFLLILLGALLNRLDFPGAHFWPGIERLTYYVAFPALLVHQLALADFAEANLVRLTAVIVTTLVVASAVIFVLRRRLASSGPELTSVYQGSIRFNSYIGLACASALYGPEGLVIAALALGIMIPLVNFLCVVAFALVDEARGVDLGRVGRGLITNPLIVGCLIGIGLNVTQLGLPGWSADTLQLLGAVALPMGLIAVGVALKPAGIGRHWPLIIKSSLLKFLLVPGLMFGFAMLLHLDSRSGQILLLLGCLPTASSAFILARQLGGDTVLMARIITLQTLMAFAVIPLWLALT